MQSYYENLDAVITTEFLPELDKSFGELDPPWDGVLAEAPQLMVLRATRLSEVEGTELLSAFYAQSLMPLPRDDAMDEAEVLGLVAIMTTRRRLAGLSIPTDDCLALMYVCELRGCVNVDCACGEVCAGERRRIEAVSREAHHYSCSRYRDTGELRISSTQLKGHGQPPVNRFQSGLISVAGAMFGTQPMLRTHAAYLERKFPVAARYDAQMMAKHGHLLTDASTWATFDPASTHAPNPAGTPPMGPGSFFHQN